MSDVDELKRLAELKDQGILTQAEFAKRKKRLLKGKRPWWLSAILGAIAIGCIVVVIAILAAIFIPAIEDHLARSNSPASELACDTAEVQETALVLTNEYISQLTSQMGVFAMGMPKDQQVHRLEDPVQLYRDAESGFIACTAKTRNEKKGAGQIGYTVSWRDRNSGEFWVEVAHAEELVSRYGNGY